MIIIIIIITILIIIQNSGSARTLSAEFKDDG